MIGLGRADTVTVLCSGRLCIVQSGSITRESPETPPSGLPPAPAHSVLAHDTSHSPHTTHSPHYPPAKYPLPSVKYPLSTVNLKFPIPILTRGCSLPPSRLKVYHSTSPTSGKEYRDPINELDQCRDIGHNSAAWHACMLQPAGGGG